MKGCRGAEGPVGGLSLAWVAPWSVRGLSSVRTPCFSHCADAVLPVFARAGQRSDTLKRVARRGRCRLLFLLGVQHIKHP